MTKRLLVGLALTVLALGSSCQSSDQPPQITSVSLNNDLTADEVAMVLLNEVDVLGTVFAVRPQAVQFNDHLDDLTDTTSEFFLSRQWLDELSGDAILANAITKYVSNDVAAEQIVVLAGDSEPVVVDTTVGDSQVVYQDGDLFTYRFAMGVYGVRLTADSLATVTDLAVIQADKLASLGRAPQIELPSNAAIQHLPASVTGGVLLGTASMTGEEWLGTINDMESAELAGFVSGGLRRWQVADRPEEIVEVVVLEMESADYPAALVAGFVSFSDVVIEIELPASIADAADAVDNVDIFETQGQVGNYFIDIAVLSPFGEVDAAAAKADLVAISEEVIAGFEE